MANILFEFIIFNFLYSNSNYWTSYYSNDENFKKFFDRETNFYIFRKLAPFNIKITTIARGIAIGDELEYADEITLGRSILNRVEFTNSYK